MIELYEARSSSLRALDKTCWEEKEVPEEVQFLELIAEEASPFAMVGQGQVRLQGRHY